LRLRFLTLFFVGAALMQLLPGAWILVKAELAQVLIARAWLAPGRAKPWPWADTWPVMRLQAPRQGVDLYVLEGARGNSLAFGPGRLHRNRASGEASLISGHRDTHFRFLKDLRSGDLLRLRSKQGDWQRWTVESLTVVDSSKQALEPRESGLYLVTCFPFYALNPGGPLRYLVHARRG
jgi:sortase A